MSWCLIGTGPSAATHHSDSSAMLKYIYQILQCEKYHIRAMVMIIICSRLNKAMEQATLHTKSCHDANFVFPVDTAGCHYEKLQSYQRWQSRYYDNSWSSVYENIHMKSSWLIFLCTHTPILVEKIQDKSYMVISIMFLPHYFEVDYMDMKTVAVSYHIH